MTLQASGTIALLDIRNEFGGAAPDSLCEYSPCIGITAGSTVSLCHFYGKSALTLGQCYCGGYYTGCLCGYYLILSPNASGCACCCWGPATTTGAISTTDGYYNTRTKLNSATYPAAYFTATRTINGYSDWYLPAKDELTVLYNNRASMPSGQGYADYRYWSSTESAAKYAWYRSFSNGVLCDDYKYIRYRVRAIRRVPG